MKRRRRPLGPRPGMVLLVVLVVVALLSLAALTFAHLMVTERQATMLSVRQAQARAAAESGIELARAMLALDAEIQQQYGGCYNNEELFRAAAVNPAGTAREQARFSLMAPLTEDGQSMGIRFGLEDESAKLNVNALLLADKMVSGGARQVLMALPGMTEQMADGILDWIDPDDEPREFGAEVESYSMRIPPYAPKNGPIDTLEELLMVQGVTPALLFGMDANRNGVIDPGEAGSEMLMDASNEDGSMDRGWSAYLTLHSMEANTRPDGRRRINVNGDDMEKLFDELSEVLDEQSATFIVAYRQNGPYKESQSGKSSKAGQGSKAEPRVTSGTLDLTQKGKVKLKTVLDLIGSPVRVTFKEEKTASILETPFPDESGAMASYLPKLMENLSAYDQPVIPGRLNINLAPRTLLMGVPEMTSEIADQIISLRQPDPAQADPNRRYETWLLEEGVVKLDQMKKMIPYLTGGGHVFRVQSVGYFDQGGLHARIEAVINATTQPPGVIFWRDMTHLGRGYSLETLGVGL